MLLGYFFHDLLFLKMHLSGIYLDLQNTNMQDAHFLGGISAKSIFFVAGKFYSKLIVKIISFFRKIYYFTKRSKAYICLQSHTATTTALIAPHLHPGRSFLLAKTFSSYSCCQRKGLYIVDYLMDSNVFETKINRFQIRYIPHL